MGERRVRLLALASVSIGMCLIGAACGDAELSVVRTSLAPEVMTPADAPVGYYAAAGTADGVVLAAGYQTTGLKGAVLPGAFRWTTGGGWKPLRQFPVGFAALGGAQVGDRVFFVGKDCAGVGIVSRPAEECTGNLLAELVDRDAWRISEIPASVITPQSTIGFVRDVDGRYLSVVPEGSQTAALALYDPSDGKWIDVGYPDGPTSPVFCQTRGNTFAGRWVELPTSTPTDQKVRYRMWTLTSDLNWGEPVEVTAAVIRNGSTTVCGLGSMMFQVGVGRQAVLERADDAIVAREISVPETIDAISWGAGRIGDRVVGPPLTPADRTLTELGTRPPNGPPEQSVESNSAVYLLTGRGALPQVQVFQAG